MNNFKKLLFITFTTGALLQAWPDFDSFKKNIKKNIESAAHSVTHVASDAASSVSNAASDAASSVSNAASSVEHAAGSAVSALTTIKVVNYTNKTIQVDYVEIGYGVGSFTIKLPRVTQADWFDSTKIITWDLKPDLLFTASSSTPIFQRSGGNAVNLVAYFPGDFYIRADLTKSN